MPSKRHSKLTRTNFLFGFKPAKVDAEKGVIEGAAVITAGPALGHGFHVDTEFLDDVAKQGNAMAHGVKVRFGHPGMSDSALGTFLGRAKNFRRDSSNGQEKTLADITISDTAAKSPKGDLKTYVLDLASKENDMFGMSISFDMGQEYQRDLSGMKIYEELNYEEPVFVELAKLWAADMVDDPAANPDGLFSATGIELPLHAAYVSRFLDAHPEIYEFASDNPDMIGEFLKRYEGLKQTQKPQTPKESPMEKTVQEWSAAYGAEFAVEYFGRMSFEDAGKKFEAEKAQRLAKEQADKIAALEADTAKLKADHAAKIAALEAEKKASEEKLKALEAGASPVPFVDQSGKAGKQPIESLFAKK